MGSNMKLMLNAVSLFFFVCLFKAKEPNRLLLVSYLFLNGTSVQEGH
jgi:hypothetical protein